MKITVVFEEHGKVFIYSLQKAYKVNTSGEAVSICMLHLSNYKMDLNSWY